MVEWGGMDRDEYKAHLTDLRVNIREALEAKRRFRVVMGEDGEQKMEEVEDVRQSEAEAG
jgi:hypothetical protein